jgi:hypothetical protein
MTGVSAMVWITLFLALTLGALLLGGHWLTAG